MIQKEYGLPQEALKLIACISMLIDHFGAAIVPHLNSPWFVELYYICRIIGRLAFPIYCFLLVEGMRRTRDPKKYFLRLGCGILLSELPFDKALFGGFTWEFQNVMITLLLGAVMIYCMQKTEKDLLKPILVVPFAVAAELLSSDYGAWGIAMIAIFALMDKLWLQVLCMTVMNGMIPSLNLPVFGWNVSIQVFAALAMVPIAFYSGRKLTRSRAVQWGFYLFYPVHLLILWMILLFIY